MSTVWMVVGTQGRWESFRKWNVKAFPTEEAAKSHAQLLLLKVHATKVTYKNALPLILGSGWCIPDNIVVEFREIDPNIHVAEISSLKYDVESIELVN